MKPILVVDDHPDSRELMAEFLSTAGYPVVEASNGAEALHLIVSEQSDEPSVIILDLEMPVMSGWEFLAVASSYQRLSRIPVLVASGHEAHLEALKRSAVVACFPKPVDLDALLAKVKELASDPPSP